MTPDSQLQDILDRSARSRLTAKAQFLRGEWPGGRIPYGYRWDGADKRFIAVAGQIEAVQAIFSLYLDDELGYERIATRLRELEYDGPRGRNWTSDQISRIVANRFYCGFIKRHDEMGPDTVWRRSPLIEPAVTEQRWTQAQTVRKARAQQPQLSLDELLR